MIAGLFPELTEPEREALIASFRELYCTSGFPGTVPYPGIPALLERLRRDGTRLFLATNKALRATRLIVEKQGWLPVFEQIHTPDSTPGPLCGKSERLRRRWPKQDSIRRAARWSGTPCRTSKPARGRNADRSGHLGLRRRGGARVRRAGPDMERSAGGMDISGTARKAWKRIRTS